MTDAVRRLSNFNFSAPDAHIALVDAAANGLQVLVTKRFGDMEKFDSKSGDFVALEESGLKVNMSIEDMLLFFTDLFPEDIETLTSAITKAKNGTELIDMLQTSVEKDGTMPFDVFTARREAFQDRLQKLDTGAMDALRNAAITINEFLDRGIKPGDTDSGSPSAPDLVEKTVMTKEEQAAADLAKQAEIDAAANSESNDSSEAESVSKAAFEESQATINKQAAQIESLLKAEDDRATATFVTKAVGYVEKGAILPEVAEGESASSKFALALKALSVAAPEAYAQVESVLEKALDTVTKGANLEEHGEAGEVIVTDLATELSKAADAVQKEHPSLTREESVAKALETNPALYEG